MNPYCIDLLPPSAEIPLREVGDVLEAGYDEEGFLVLRLSSVHASGFSTVAARLGRHEAHLFRDAIAELARSRKFGSIPSSVKAAVKATPAK